MSETANSKEASAIAIEMLGRPDKCHGWKAKIFNAAHEGALRGIERGEALSRNAIDALDDDLSRARFFGAQVLLARLPRAPIERREGLRGRIALIRSGAGDTLPEVQAALLAIEASKGNGGAG